jgi:hypothetical protein
LNECFYLGTKNYFIFEILLKRHKLSILVSKNKMKEKRKVIISNLFIHAYDEFFFLLLKIEKKKILLYSLEMYPQV